MPVIAVVNRKGGSGKSTFAANLAAWCARQGHATMLGDVDRQQSSRGWLRRRPASLPVIAPWAMDQKNVLRVPTGITHVVLDTPGGLHGFELARIVMFADAIVMPVCPSLFDRESAASCHAELLTLPRVASGRCRLATVGMRVDGRTNAAAVLREWSEGLQLPMAGVLRETQLYVRCLERGLTLFDLPRSQAAADLEQWAPILEWLRPLLDAPQAANDPTPASRPPAVPVSRVLPAVAPGSRLQPAAVPVSRVLAPAVSGSRVLPASSAAQPAPARPSSLMPAQESLLPGGRLAPQPPARPAREPASPATPLVRTPAPALARQIPQFLKR